MNCVKIILTSKPFGTRSRHVSNLSYNFGGDPGADPGFDRGGPRSLQA